MPILHTIQLSSSGQNISITPESQQTHYYYRIATKFAKVHLYLLL